MPKSKRQCARVSEHFEYDKFKTFLGRHLLGLSEAG
jgi:hypothetical protein